jgi:hypothetical protein
MRRALPSLAALIRSPDFPFLTLWLASLLVGVFIFQDFGLSWDEPLFYQYSDAVGSAYSIPDWLTGSVDLEQAYGPSAEDHKIYGAAYLLVGRNLTRLLQALTGIEAWTVWHLTNFLAFELGVLFLYLLCKRWMQPPAATIATALYATQPVVWGHAFINPKDMPFATLFILAVYAGFRMVDRLSAMGLRSSRSADERDPHRSMPAAPRSRPISVRSAAILAIACALIGVLLAVFGEGWRGALGEMVRQAYYAPPESALGRAFAWLASSRAIFSVDYYLGRVYSAYRWVNAAIGLVALALGGVFLAKRYPAHAERLRGQLEGALVPLPRWPALACPGARLPAALSAVLLPGLLLGMLTAVRVLGPLAGLLVIAAYVLQPQRRSWLPIIVYLAVACLTMLACWPYLWPAPAERFAEVLRHMADNPKLLPVLYAGSVFASNQLPASYLPRMLALTLTEPVWPLAIAGLAVSGVRFARSRIEWRTWIQVVLWLVVPCAYVITQHPAMYDGYRHFLFILPPIFIACGLALDALWSHLRAPVAQALIGLALLLPGLLGLVRLHPYPYAYYNEFAGGINGAFRRYETDYWLTCYKETVEALEAQGLDTVPLFVHRQPAIARAYAGAQWRIEPFDPDADEASRGSLLLLTTRSNTDLAIHPDDPVILTVGRQGATFCVVKRVLSE